MWMGEEGREREAGGKKSGMSPLSLSGVPGCVSGESVLI